MYKQVLLVILDGFGYRESTVHNAIASANTPFWDSIYHKNHSLLKASGLAVGLPEGQMGNSEVGHMTIGAGRPIDTDLVRISKSINEGEFFKSPVLLELCQFLKRHNSTLHIFGLVSPGGVHSHSDHMHAMVKLCKEQGINKVALHVITDGRDAHPESAGDFVAELEAVLEAEGVGKIVSVCGRYYAMDRDGNWERTSKAASAMFTCEGEACTLIKPSHKIKELYAQGKSDEFFEPLVFLDGEQGTNFQKHDAAIFLNFRADRARQLAKLIDEKTLENDGMFLTLTEYEAGQRALSVFPPAETKTTLASCLSEAGLTQAHIAETEKYAHVTYFLNGGVETAHVGENFILVESRKDVATHDLAPEMKAAEVTDKAVEEIKKGTNFIVINYANADMVAHSGNYEPTVKAIECLDRELSRLCEAAKLAGTPVFITSDHGNAEENVDVITGNRHTAHTTNLVPAVLTGDNPKLRDGELSDVAPTILALLGIEKPSIMTGKNLLQ